MGTKLSDLPALGGTPATGDELPITDVSAADATKKVTVAELAAAVGAAILAPPIPLTVASYADPVVQTAATDLGGAGVTLYPVGLGGPVDMAIGPNQPAAGPGKGLTLQAGVGAADESGGHATIDAGGSNGGSSVAGNVKIGRDNAAEVLIGKEGGGGIVTLEGTTTTVGHTPSNIGDIATKGYVDQPAARAEAGASDTIVAADIGGVLFYVNAGAVAVALPDLSAEVIPGGERVLVLTIQATGAATVVTITPGVGVTIDGSGSAHVAPTGRARVSLVSRDGLAWFSGTP